MIVLKLWNKQTISVQILFLLVVMIVLMGCHGRRYIPVESDKADEVAQSIVAALDAKDEEALKALFSPKALERATDLDKGLAFIMDVYHGKSTGVSSHGTSYPEYKERGNGTRKIAGNFHVSTDEKKYVLSFDYWTLYEADNDMEGLYTIMFYPQGEEGDQMDFGNTREKEVKPGIYYPVDPEEDAEAPATP